VTAPRVAIWSTEGGYEAPDIEVDLEPAAWRQGHDTQLERSVAFLMEAMAKQPPVVAKRPAYPTWPKEGGSTHQR
jgi:tricorn protease